MLTIPLIIFAALFLWLLFSISVLPEEPQQDKADPDKTLSPRLMRRTPQNDDEAASIEGGVRDSRPWR